MQLGEISVTDSVKNANPEVIPPPAATDSREKKTAPEEKTVPKTVPRGRRELTPEEKLANEQSLECCGNFFGSMPPIGLFLLFIDMIMGFVFLAQRDLRYRIANCKSEMASISTCSIGFNQTVEIEGYIFDFDNVSIVYRESRYRGTYSSYDVYYEQTYFGTFNSKISGFVFSNNTKIMYVSTEDARDSYDWLSTTEKSEYQCCFPDNSIVGYSTCPACVDVNISKGIKRKTLINMAIAGFVLLAGPYIILYILAIIIGIFI